MMKIPMLNVEERIECIKNSHLYHQMVTNHLMYKNLLTSDDDPLRLEEVVDTAFYWSNTPEGQDFWQDVDEELDDRFDI